MNSKKKSEIQRQSTVNLLTDKAAMMIAVFFMRIQDAFVKWMTKRTKKFSARIWKWLIIVFALGWGSLNMHFIISAFEKKRKEIYKGSSIQFIIKPAGNDSLALMEEIYEQEKSRQILSPQQQTDTIKFKK
jgi:hypothetical protein